MIEPGRKRRMTGILVSGLAVAAVAGVAIAGTAMARSGRPDVAVGGGGPATPVLQTPATPSAAQTPVSATRKVTPAATPRIAQTPVPSSKVVVPRPKPQKPQEQQPPADPVAACKQWLKDTGEGKPGSRAKAVARLDGTPGTVLILADSNYWAGCDTAYARTGGGQGSIRQPTKLANPAPGDAEAFTVANNLIPINGKQYEYYWAAGQLPSGVTKISYAFPDGRTTNAVVQGKYWVMQHQTATPWKEGTAPTTLIKVTLYGANGHALRDFLLVWGEDTCAQISHGC
ncbi:hypothetical protein OG555_15185 [Kribbella sp. NBC_01484]|uniref:hypothetical protein n=1 Tax=Kribbella sp. NBC_01484 TaxID=2903579 RepID=UPI002E3613E2|nr:hypothetical protein [Kribbella sp. NBC_01484]